MTNTSARGRHCSSHAETIKRVVADLKLLSMWRIDFKISHNGARFISLRLMAACSSFWDSHEIDFTGKKLLNSRVKSLEARHKASGRRGIDKSSRVLDLPRNVYTIYASKLLDMPTSREMWGFGMHKLLKYSKDCSMNKTASSGAICSKKAAEAF